MLLTPSEVASIVPEAETPPIDDEVELAWEKYRLAFLHHQNVKMKCQYSSLAPGALADMKAACAETTLALYEYFEVLDCYQATTQGSTVEDVPFMSAVPPLIIPPRMVLPPYMGEIGTGPEDCWICGRPGMTGHGDTLQCPGCDVSWNKTELTPTVRPITGTIWQNGVPLEEIDFTQPDAPSSPG